MSLPGYHTEMRLIEQGIADMGGAEALAEPIDPERLTQYIYHLYQRGSIAGDLVQLSAVKLAIDHALPLLANPGDLCLLKANVAFKLHKLTEVGRGGPRRCTLRL
jgi:hypothetical protein